MSEKITLGKSASSELVEKKSIFRGYAAPVESEAEAQAFVEEVRKKHPEARHTVYAYLLGTGGIARCSDDGEPQGSAGVPVLDVIRKGGFSDAVIAVSRVFGGILLGAGGLVRAYSAAAKLAVDAAGIVTYRTFTEVLLTCSYSDRGKLGPLLSSDRVISDGIEYAENVSLSLALPEEDFPAFAEEVKELTAGRVSLSVKGTRFDRICKG